MSFSRRHFLTHSGIALSSVAFGSLFRARNTSALAATGRLIPDPNGIIDLPEGFTYKVLDRAGAMMSDGLRVPADPDGMGLFMPSAGELVLMRNHEISVEEGGGGVTRIVLSPSTLEVQSSSLVLQGTDRNCGGGVSPWGWLSCEESKEDDRGFVYLCPLEAEGLGQAQKITAYGRFCHESVVVDPVSHAAYMTEDEGDSCFYRFLPHSPERPFAGTLQALRARDRSRLDTTRMRTGEQLTVEWVTVEDTLARRKATREQAQRLGAATFRAGEGMVGHGGRVYFSATKGGPLEKGQIFSYAEGADRQSGLLTLVATASIENEIDCPDALACSPAGDLYVAEDGDGLQFIRVIKPDGRVATLAKNRASKGEFAGLCMTPDSRTLFLNMQADGLTLAISGPFGRI